MIKLFCVSKYTADQWQSFCISYSLWMDVFFRSSRPYGGVIEQFAKYLLANVGLCSVHLWRKSVVPNLFKLMLTKERRLMKRYGHSSVTPRSLAEVTSTRS